MSTRLTESRFEPRRRPRRRPRWAEARRAFDALMADPDDTQKAVDVLYALDPDAPSRDFARFLSHPAGRRLFASRSSLREALRAERLRPLPADSLGRAYLAHLERWELDTGKLFELSQARTDDAEDADTDDGLRWFLERSVLLHDLWHVLAGYGADDRGEAALLPFSFAQQGGLGRGLLALGSVLTAWKAAGRRWPRDVLAAWRQGRGAADLSSVAYEELLAEPLDDVRTALGLRPPEVAHRGRIPVGPTSAMQRARDRALASPRRSTSVGPIRPGSALRPRDEDRDAALPRAPQ